MSHNIKHLPIREGEGQGPRGGCTLYVYTQLHTRGKTEPVYRTPYLDQSKQLVQTGSTAN